MSLLDILPTALSLLGIGVPDELDGVDLARSMTEGVASDDLGREMLLHLDFRGGRYLALRTATEKLMVGRDPYRKELFDLAGDPKEKTNLLRVRPPASFATLAQDLAVEHNRLASRALGRDGRGDSGGDCALGSYVGTIRTVHPFPDRRRRDSPLVRGGGITASLVYRYRRSGSRKQFCGFGIRQKGVRWTGPARPSP